ncbi:MAG: hypothetical protein HYW34_03970 [Candidatus Brennerbacteria bacterium]|nr:hypothetical protein [Candidatus Brennerbacteria bacterium]
MDFISTSAEEKAYSDNPFLMDEEEEEPLNPKSNDDENDDEDNDGLDNY